MCKFLFKDIVEKPAFRTFFSTGQEFDKNFIYEVTFGFMPRQFKDSPQDRYFYLEEGNATEIYFITKGKWAIAFNGYVPPSDGLFDDDPDMLGPLDMQKEARYIAIRHQNFGFIGDYYLLASKKS